MWLFFFTVVCFVFFPISPRPRSTSLSRPSRLTSFTQHPCSPVAWKGGSLTKHYTLHLYQTKHKHFFFVLNAESGKFFFHPFPPFTCQELTGLGIASICQPLASEEDSEKIIQPSIRKRRGERGDGIKRWPRWCTLWPRGRICRSCSS